jgi:hypothetical protein
MMSANFSNPAPIKRSAVRHADSFARVAVAVLVLLAVIDSSSIEAELRFFSPSSITAANGSAPVPQDSIRSPDVDQAFRRAANALQSNAVCVIDKDAWNEDYFRASYVMMPRRIWPSMEDSRHRILTAGGLADAMHAHDATCLLLSAHSPVPRGLMRRTSGYYSLYVRAPSARSR